MSEAFVTPTPHHTHCQHEERVARIERQTEEHERALYGDRADWRNKGGIIAEVRLLRFLLQTLHIPVWLALILGLLKWWMDTR